MGEQGEARRCQVEVRQFAAIASYRAEEMIRGTLLFEARSSFGLRRVEVRARWRPVGESGWRQANAEAFSGEVELSLGQPAGLSFTLQAPAGPFSREAGQLVHEWGLCVELPLDGEQGELLVTQVGAVDFELSPGLESVVGEASAVSEAPRLVPSPLSVGASVAPPNHVFSHESYRLALSLLEGVYAVGDTLRGEVDIEAYRDVPCRRVSVALTQYLVDLDKSTRSKRREVKPLLVRYEDEHFLDSHTWHEGRPGRCAFSIQLPELPVSFSGRRYRVEWEVSFTAELPWARDPSVSRVFQLTEAPEALAEAAPVALALCWPLEGRAWFNKKTTAQQRWEALRGEVRVQPSPLYQGGSGALSMSIQAVDFTRLAEISVTLFGAEREADEDWFAPVSEGIWRREEFSLCLLRALSPGQSLSCSQAFRIPASGPASSSEGEASFSWWLVFALAFVDLAPLQFAIPLWVLPRSVSGEPFR